MRNTCQLLYCGFILHSFHHQPRHCANVGWLIRACWLLAGVPKLLEQQIGHMATLVCDYLLIANRVQIFEFSLTGSQGTACLRSYKHGLSKCWRLTCVVVEYRGWEWPWLDIFFPHLLLQELNLIISWSWVTVLRLCASANQQHQLFVTVTVKMTHVYIFLITDLCE